MEIIEGFAVAKFVLVLYPLSFQSQVWKEPKSTNLFWLSKSVFELWAVKGPIFLFVLQSSRKSCVTRLLVKSPKPAWYTFHFYFASFHSNFILLILVPGV